MVFHGMEKGDPTVDVLNVEDTVKAFDSQYYHIYTSFAVNLSQLVDSMLAMNHVRKSGDFFQVLGIAVTFSLKCFPIPNGEH